MRSPVQWWYDLTGTEQTVYTVMFYAFAIAAVWQS